MPKLKTKKEIMKEVKALQACKDYAPHYTAFGDDNHASIDLQIDTLEKGFDTIGDGREDLSDDEQSAVQAAMDWGEGRIDESPSSGWDSYKPKS